MHTPLPHPSGLQLNTVLPPLKLGNFRLIAFDMDSTLINIECIDEIAEPRDRAQFVRDTLRALGSPARS